jgi:hypothetical protein
MHVAATAATAAKSAAAQPAVVELETSRAAEP